MLDWQKYIQQYILPNHSQWGDHAYSHLPLTAVKRYLIATHWSNARGPTILGRKESSVQSVAEFLVFFPSPQSTIYIIVELVPEEISSDSGSIIKEDVSKAQGKQKTKQPRNLKTPLIKVERGILNIKEDNIVTEGEQRHVSTIVNI